MSRRDCGGACVNQISHCRPHYMRPRCSIPVHAPKGGTIGIECRQFVGFEADQNGSCAICHAAWLSPYGYPGYTFMA
jgi:hypothetical protein